MNELEVIERFVSRFIKKDKRERSLFELQSSKKRGKFLSRICGNWEELFEGKMFKYIERKDFRFEELVNTKRIHAHAQYYLISSFSYDRQIAPLDDMFNDFFRGCAESIAYDFKNDIVLYTEEMAYDAPRCLLGRLP